MFSNIAYEAFYQYLGLGLHVRIVEAITSEAFFKGLVLIIFGLMFITTAVKFSSRYLAGSLVQRKTVPLSRFALVFLYLILGLSLLKVEVRTSVKDYGRQSWHDNGYIKGKIQSVQPEYKVSLPFDLMTRTAEEVSALLSRIIDKVFMADHSQLESPNLFYKAIIHSASSTFSDPKIRDAVSFYNTQCLEKVLPLIGNLSGKGIVGRAYAAISEIDTALSEIKMNVGTPDETDCHQIKEEVRSMVLDSARAKSSSVDKSIEHHMHRGALKSKDAMLNLYASNMLVNQYMEDKESYAGLMKGAQPTGVGARVAQYLGRTMSWDGFINIISFGEGKDTFGAASAAKKASEFSENLARAPHLAGMVKLLLIIVFPFLIFFVVAGKWKVLIWWWLIYFSVTMWAPLWTLFYHIMLNISKSSSVMQQFGELSDGISLYGASLIQSRMYYMHTVYSWLQLLVGITSTGGALFFLKPMLGANAEETAPEFIKDTADAASTTSRVAKGGL